MRTHHNLEDQVDRLANEYFSLLARSFPVMCASDEFHFLPRVQEAAQYLERVDDLSEEAVLSAIESVRNFRTQLLRLPELNHLEKELDRQLLLHNMAGFLFELEEVQSWRYNPLLYLKIACMGLDHALNKPASSLKERVERTIERLIGLNRLLDQAQANLETIPEPYYRASLAMTADAQQYLDEIQRRVDLWGQEARLAESCKCASAALVAFLGRMRRITPVSSAAVKGVSVERLVEQHFGCPRPLGEIYAIAQKEWRHNQDELERLRRNINPKKNWQQLYKTYWPVAEDEPDLFQLYDKEIASLRNFCSKLKLVDGSRDQEVVLSETPTYLRSVRSAASYSTPLGVDPHEEAYFYITGNSISQSSEVDVLRRQRLHREFRFLSAHETYPGHHLLDSIRRRLANPVRRQIESPLFYEGWAYYAESILVECGHVREDLELLVDCKRRLWRAARCMIDTGLALGCLKSRDGAELLVSVGFGMGEAVAQVKRFHLNPGYQLCYSLGKYEIVRLRQRFASRIGWQRFHHLLLEGGELPFHLASRRFEKLIEEEGGSGSGSEPGKPVRRIGTGGQAGANDKVGR